METNTFNYLGDILLHEQLFHFAQIIRENFPGTVEQNTKLSEKLEALSCRANTWPSEILWVYRERQVSLYNSEDIVKLNTQNASEIQMVNGSRTKLEKGFQDQIDAFTVQIQQSRGQLETRLAG